MTRKRARLPVLDHHSLLALYSENIPGVLKLMNDEPSFTKDQMATLKARVFALVRACPAGQVTTYGWLAKCAGYPDAARIVGWIMYETSPGVPAQRVINSKGELSGSWAFGSPDRMRQLLETEGIVFSEKGKVDLKRYGWDPSRDLSPAQIEEIFSRIDESSEQPSPRLMSLVNRGSIRSSKKPQQNSSSFRNPDRIEKGSI